MDVAADALWFGPFELLQVLGGGMDVVYRARREGSATDVALKLLRQERRLDGEARLRFAREQQVMARLRHANICPIDEVGVVDGMPYLCMPLLPGASLADRIAAARDSAVGAPVNLPGPTTGPRWRGVVAMAQSVADALEAVHRVGIVHRDIKPSNLLVTPEGQPILLDFGLAWRREGNACALTRTGQFIGTPAYMAPEQLSTRPAAADPRIDVYGLGAVMFEALTLRAPFVGRSREELFAEIMHGPSPDVRAHLHDVPEAVATVVQKALQRHRKDRYQSAARFREDLDRLLRGEPVVAVRPSAALRVCRAITARPLQAALIGALLTLSLVIAASVWRTLQVAGETEEYNAEVEQWRWGGLWLLGRTACEQLPPPWPAHREQYHRWLNEYGDRLLMAPPAVDELMPGMRAWVTEAVADVRERLAFAERAALVMAGPHAELWAAARRAISADRRYGGHQLAVEPGLVPLGSAPDSGLLEFYDLASGDDALAPPERDAEGRVRLSAGHGIVFVLVPAANATGLPFLLGKHELTRAQQAKLDRGRDPSPWPLGVLRATELQTPRHPVACISWDAQVAMLARWGLELPTEAEWLHAATAGTGAEESPTGNYGGAGDGYAGTAPVGSFPANAFGLHDMFGNVAELTADALDPVVDGRVVMRVERGGSFTNVPVPATYRGQTWADQTKEWVGVRVVRRLAGGR